MILRYLCQELGLATGQLNNLLQSQQGISPLVDKFGSGILVLLPKVASHRYADLSYIYVVLTSCFSIIRLGLQKLDKIFDVIYTALSQSKALCKMAEASILVPLISTGTVPRLLSSDPAARARLSVMEALSPVDPVDTPESSPALNLLELTIRSQPSGRSQDSPLLAVHGLSELEGSRGRSRGREGGHRSGDRFNLSMV